jgi:3-hydroxy acid dehydrogenase / malonic semialdehyde reductase
MLALITGATSGIGEATARILASNSYDLIITGRRKDRLEKLSAAIVKENKVKVLPLVFDVRHQTETEQTLGALPPEWKSIDVLVNNAGLAAGLAPVHEGLLSDWEQMIDTNVKGLLYVSRIIITWMIERNKGHIVNISSIAGKEAYDNGNVYCGTKHAVEAISKSMRIELLKYNIKVSTISPGAVDTEFSNVRFKGDTGRAKAVYKGYTPLNAMDIAESILFAVTRPAHVNINDILIMPTAQANATNFFRKQD